MSHAFEIGKKMVDLCRQGKNLEAIETLFADNAVSLEAAAMEGHGREMKGKEAIRGKNQWWFENHEVHTFDVTGPFPNGDDNQYAVFFKMDVTQKADGQRFQMEEVGVYDIKDGKIVKEEFLYHFG